MKSKRMFERHHELQAEADELIAELDDSDPEFEVKALEIRLMQDARLEDEMSNARSDGEAFAAKTEARAARAHAKAAHAAVLQLRRDFNFAMKALFRTLALFVVFFAVIFFWHSFREPVLALLWR